MIVKTLPFAHLSEVKTQPFLDALAPLLDDSAALIGIKDLDLRYTFANCELETALNQPPGGLIGKRLDEILHTPLAEHFITRDRHIIAKGEPIRTVDEIAVGDRKGSFASARFPIRDENKRVVGVGLLAIEIGESSSLSTDAPATIIEAQNMIEKLRGTVEELSQRASTDSLTGIANRRSIEETARQEQHRLQRYGHPVSMVFCDLDHFKRINDTYGHAVGDEVLRGFCDVVRGCVRTTDYIGRWGGEEFLVVLPNSSLDVARLLAERIRVTLASQAISEVQKVTASFGVAEAERDDNLATWLARADLALYKAKKKGRNRVVAICGRKTDKSEIDTLDKGFMRVVWRPAYESGHPVIDGQHRRLFDHINVLLNAIVGERPKAEVMPLISDFIDEVVAHFAEEETIVAATAYPNAKAHNGIHRSLLDHALEMTEKYEQNALGVGELISFLAHDVVTQHMLSEDRGFFPYLAVQKDCLSLSKPA